MAVGTYQSVFGLNDRNWEHLQKDWAGVSSWSNGGALNTGDHVVSGSSAPKRMGAFDWRTLWRFAWPVVALACWVAFWWQYNVLILFLKG